jgi:uncharacterized protein
MFYAVLALLVHEPYSSYKHSGILSYFNRRFKREGVFPDSIGRSINNAFELRQRGDYRKYSDVSLELVKPFLPEARIFIQAIRDYLDIQ